jgi:hypothetical protein
LQAAQTQSLRDRIAQAVEDGTITQEQADWLLEGIDRGWMGGMRHGFGFEPGLRFRSPRLPRGAPSATSSGTAG